jgi:hypothetical protein
MELYENFSVEEKISITEEKPVATQSNLNSYAKKSLKIIWVPKKYHKLFKKSAMA